ncbi:transposase [Chitinimonas sp. BJB300]
MTFWYSPEVTWYHNEREGKAGAPTLYSDQVIRIMLTLKAPQQQC